MDYPRPVCLTINRLTRILISTRLDIIIPIRVLPLTVYILTILCTTDSYMDVYALKWLHINFYFILHFQQRVSSQFIRLLHKRAGYLSCIELLTLYLDGELFSTLGNPSSSPPFFVKKLLFTLKSAAGEQNFIFFMFYLGLKSIKILLTPCIIIIKIL
jgi:hypothetical protein